ncbi:hypothetical protein ACFRMQ_38225 [Kitasatospora sp. NPDC056783]|uniref:hypothetical protein n=1 Tax=Kitasatospora sp. NPDC056783 TaxID=3345943 RepID=UPI0036AFD95C
MLVVDYDGKNTDWIAVTSFIGPADDLKVPELLEFLGEDWKLPATAIVDKQLSLRHHFGLPETAGGKGDGSGGEGDPRQGIRVSGDRRQHGRFLEANILEQDEE